jgi:hypothetical protein
VTGAAGEPIRDVRLLPPLQTQKLMVAMARDCTRLEIRARKLRAQLDDTEHRMRTARKLLRDFIANVAPVEERTLVDDGGTLP